MSSLDSKDQLQLIATMIYAFDKVIPVDFLPLVINGMKHLRANQETSIIYSLARVLGTLHPNGGESLLSVKRMPFGLIEYVIIFFGASSTQKVYMCLFIMLLLCLFVVYYKYV